MYERGSGMKVYIKKMLALVLACGLMMTSITVEAEELDVSTTEVIEELDEIDVLLTDETTEEISETSKDITIEDAEYEESEEVDAVGADLVSGDYKYKVLSDGTVEITKYIGTGKKITIPSILGGKSVTSIGKKAFLDCASLTSVTIPSGVTKIGEYAFDDCTSLVSVTIPSSVTKMDEGAFCRCSSLTSVTIPKGITTIGEGLFANCSSLTSITIPNGVTKIEDGAFYYSGLTSITIPNDVTSIGSMAFSYCYALTSVTIPSGVTSIGEYAFQDCTNLTSVTIPSGVTTIEQGVFTYCTSLTSVTIPSGVTTIGKDAFAHCTKLADVTMEKGVTSISDRAFYNCIGLTSVTIPNSVTSIGQHAFAYCANLTSVTIPSSVTSIGDGAFDYTAAGKIIYGNKGSYAESFAAQKGYTYKYSVGVCKVTLSKTTYTYDGKQKKPTVTVKDGTTTLKNGTDYTVTYPSKGAMGKATVIITGKGAYIGTFKKTITINKLGYYNVTTDGGEWKNEIYKLGGVKMTDIFFCDGTYTYYLQADGTPMKNRLTYHPDGVHLIYFDSKGHELFDKFQYCADVGYTCYFDTNGYLYKDVITFSNGKPYYLDGNGKMKQDEYFTFNNGVDRGYAQADGSLMNTGFGYDPSGNTVFYHWNGMIARGLITDGQWYYDMDLTDGHLLGQFAAN